MNGTTLEGKIGRIRTSEGLEALSRLKKEVYYNPNQVNDINEYYSSIEEELYYAEECRRFENELGCPIKAIFQAQMQRYLYSTFDKIINIYCKFDDNGGYFTNGYNKFYFKNYKVTWWLQENKEE